MYRYGKTINVYGDVDTDFYHVVDMDEILELVEKCNHTEREKILKVIDETEPNEGRIKKELYINDYVSFDFDYEIDFHQILDLISSCSLDEKEEIISEIGLEDDSFFVVNNLYDEQKVKLLKEAFNKYSLEELQNRLNLK
jgi:hypothetical protein